MQVIAAVFGILLMLFGLVLPSGNGDVSNLAAMNLKTNLVVLGAALFVGGVVADAASRVVKALEMGWQARAERVVEGSGKGTVA